MRALHRSLFFVRLEGAETGERKESEEFGVRTRVANNSCGVIWLSAREFRTPAYKPAVTEAATKSPEVFAVPMTFDEPTSDGKEEVC